jgi:hypothetical protein
MNVTQAMAMVEISVGDASVCINVEYWKHSDGRSTPRYDVGYRISVIPGWTGAKCDSESGRNLDDVVAAVISHYQPRAATDRSHRRGAWMPHFGLCTLGGVTRQGRAAD